MATVIWCDRVKHVVRESRTEVDNLITRTGALIEAGSLSREIPQFIYFTINDMNLPGDVEGGHQRALNLSLISSFEAHPGDPV